LSKSMMSNPIIAEITRGGIVESRHTGAFVVSDASGTIMAQAGEVSRPIFPRSAIKAFQCLPLVESGAADHFGLNDEEIALCCASHNGEADHVRVARSILAKVGIDETCYECGSHWPTHRAAAYELVRAGQASSAVHNNCSGKHAGMLALAKYLNAPLTDYVKSDHPVQQKIAASLAQYCEVDIANAPMGIDGCSVPTWAMPLKNLALGFAKFNNGRILNAVKAHPFMVAGSGKFDTEIMQAIPRLFIKYGAEGVYCGTIAHAGLGFAMKCDDGAARAVEVAIAGMLAKLEVWTDEEKQALNGFAQEDMSNWRKIPVGQIRVAF
jgi:L-asparaginase II